MLQTPTRQDTTSTATHPDVGSGTGLRSSESASSGQLPAGPRFLPVVTSIACRGLFGAIGFGFAGVAAGAIAVLVGGAPFLLMAAGDGIYGLVWMVLGGVLLVVLLMLFGGSAIGNVALSAITGKRSYWRAIVSYIALMTALYVFSGFFAKLGPGPRFTVGPYFAQIYWPAFASEAVGGGLAVLVFCNYRQVFRSAVASILGAFGFGASLALLLAGAGSYVPGVETPVPMTFGLLLWLITGAAVGIALPRSRTSEIVTEQPPAGEHSLHDIGRQDG